MKKKQDLATVKITTLIVSLIMLFKPLIPLVEYVVFYDYIKNELCINKDKSKLACNGKCFLKKELAKASGSEKGNDKKHISVEAGIVFYQEAKRNFSFQDFFYTATLKIPSIHGNLSYSFLNTDSLFRPPIA